jgi:hypothetical protein
VVLFGSLLVASGRARVGVFDQGLGLVLGAGAFSLCVGVGSYLLAYANEEAAYRSYRSASDRLERAEAEAQESSDEDLSARFERLDAIEREYGERRARLSAKYRRHPVMERSRVASFGAGGAGLILLATGGVWWWERKRAEKLMA